MPIHANVPIITWPSTLSPDGESVAVSYGDNLRLYNRTSGDFSTIGHLPHTATSLAFSPDGKWLAAVGEARTLILYSFAEKTQYALANGEEIGTAFAFAEDSSRIAIGFADGSARIVRPDDLTSVRLDAHGGSRVTSLRFAPDGRSLTVGRSGGALDLFNVSGGSPVRRLEGLNGDTLSQAYLKNGIIAGLGASGEIKLWSVHTGAPLLSFFLTESGGWLAVAPEGAFDSSEIENASAVSWLMPDDPLRPLAPEIFMRDYFEPRLVSRLLACRAAEAQQPDACEKAFAKVRPLASLNRVQPGVKILSVKQGAKPDEAAVEVEVSSAEDLTQPNGKTRTEAFDLRLFRDGQLVGRLPQAPDGSDKIEAWRQRTRIIMPDGHKSLRHSFVVRLPTAERKTPIAFSAYAFNEDRVKSATARDESFHLPKGGVPRKPKAYVISVGINGYEAPSRKLSFAVSDAQAMSRALSRLEGYEVIDLTLTSEADSRTWRATKANIREVLARLAGQAPTPGTLAGVAHAEQLAQATPDDLVILSFSGHGHTDPDGTFYLLPSDSGPAEPTITPAALKRFISSEELSAWLGPIDAGQMAMIIDACHSAASVDRPGFKPGPMGDRGLGQLAYDKAMRILAASQADDVALESNKLRQGLLTYALVRDGLAPVSDTEPKRLADLDRNGVLTLTEWLKYGEQRTPALYEDIRANRLTPRYVGKDPTLDPRFRQTVIQRAQTPALFDFARPSLAPIVLQ
jgi:hypothetical protein